MKRFFENNYVITSMYLAVATLVAGFFFTLVPTNSVNTCLVYILAIILIARKTNGFRYGIIASIFGVICVNFLFTYPFFAFNFSISGYPVTFIGMFTISIITSTSTTILKRQSEIIAEREKEIAESEKERMRATLLRAVSHDLRTPLACIISSTSSYLEDNAGFSDEELKELMTRIQEDANWLLHMVENLLSVTRIQDAERPVTKNAEIVEEVISEAVERIRKRIPDSKITVYTPGDILIVPMDGVLIEQVIINLLENAIIHSESTAPIELYVTEENDSIAFHVKDYGKGIAAEKLDHIFDMNSTNTSSDSHKGMGIGLSICKTIITAHNGTISARNHKHGAEFTFKLPKEVANES